MGAWWALGGGLAFEAGAHQGRGSVLFAATIATTGPQSALCRLPTTSHSRSHLNLAPCPPLPCRAMPCHALPWPATQVQLSGRACGRRRSFMSSAWRGCGAAAGGARAWAAPRQTSAAGCGWAWSHRQVCEWQLAAQSRQLGRQHLRVLPTLLHCPGPGSPPLECAVLRLLTLLLPASPASPAGGHCPGAGPGGGCAVPGLGPRLCRQALCGAPGSQRFRQSAAAKGAAE